MDKNKPSKKAEVKKKVTKLKKKVQEMIDSIENKNSLLLEAAK